MNVNICINSLKKERQEANIKGEGGERKNNTKYV